MLQEKGYIKDLEEYNDGAVPMLKITMKYGQK